MCWILFVHSKIALSNQIINKRKINFNKIAHRWPDFHYFYTIDKRIILWFHRLSIMDTSANGNQPFIYYHKWKTIYALCNWEIFNHKELITEHNLEVKSKSDCEVIWLLYIKYGFKKCIQLLRWEFACVLYETWNEWETIYVARDQVWVRPLFYSVDNSCTSFSSELKWLIWSWNHIDQFPPASIMIIHNQKIHIEQYHDISHIQTTIKEENKAIELIKTWLVDSVGVRLMSDRPIWCLLSWWLDSSLICGISRMLLGNDIPLHTFTIWLEWWTDIPYANLVAQHVNSIHHVVTITINDALSAIYNTIKAIEIYDITTIRASIFQYLLGEYISKYSDIKVLLCWELSDELFSGYRYFHNAPDPLSMHQENLKLINNVHRFDGLRTDRTMASHGLEVRLPFADTQFIDTILWIDPKIRMPTYWIEKYILRKAFSKTNVLPNEILRRAKEAFSDGVSSQQNSRFQILQHHIETLISDDEFLQESQKISFNQPPTKEAYYYRKLFWEIFGTNHDHITPYYLLPNWSDGIKEPSARVLKINPNC